MATIGTPVAELTIDVQSVRELLKNQHPDLERLPAVLFGVTLADTGLIDDSRHFASGEKILCRVVAGP